MTQRSRSSPPPPAVIGKETSVWFTAGVSAIGAKADRTFTGQQREVADTR